MPESSVLYERDGLIGRLTLNRPDTMNALSEDLMEELLLALRRANADPGTRTVLSPRQDRISVWAAT